MTRHDNTHKHGRKSYEYDWFYHSRAWKKLRQMALDRDNNLCQMCLLNGNITDATIVHHIVYVDDDFDKALNLDNLLSVCHSCHNKIHANDQDRNNIKIIRVAKI
ncbi:HNH endonuclease signature motif containing protein [Staphylococcus sp. NRL 16/872]|uniref:HNH endonuclease n=1 Tax=Staphylococcus sp. NRL 16/872 TaxID=2930131 RepID=UPI001FB1F7A5|nr:MULTISPECIES: HNH endonuclease signature motif containing protein [unclassified Staphylococcus]MCJ1656702.1 HNH endonuclease [Staphylococcus sp. NRL 21/187]MCJ1662453.1 HNH endonuclease [Staphylococcus sp. NRL 18/288]WEN68762.1 HNH endonuclease signature motif containing protein [Staphylococcus sp. NRL 16/872]